MKKLLAIVLGICMLIPMFTLTSYAASLRSDSSVDIITFGERVKSLKFTPEESGVYRFFTHAPSGFLGRIINRLNKRETDPFIEIFDSDGYSVGYADDSYLYYDEVIEDYYRSSDFDAYVYLEAGETYYIDLRDISSKLYYFFNLEFAVPTFGAFGLSVNYCGKVESIKLALDTKTVFSVSKGEAYYDEEDGYILNIAHVYFDVVFDSGMRQELDNDRIVGLDWDYYYKKCNLGRNQTTFFCLGEEIPYTFTIVK